MGAPKNNKYAQQYTKKEAIFIFYKMYNYAINSDECLCLQDAFLSAKMPSSTFYYLCNQYKELESIKKDMKDVIISRVNKCALKNKFNSTASIWRMKQLGETDRQEVHNYNEDVVKYDVSKKGKEDLDKIINADD